MNQNLTIALIQSDISWENKSENIKRFTEKINEVKTAIDIFILPEMFSTGFTMNPEHLAETMDEKTVLWMKKMAAKKNAAIAGSIIIFEENKYFNRFLFVHPSGEIDSYDKKHVFTLAGEDMKFTNGKNKQIINYKDWKICPMICYDVRFPAWARNQENYDLLIYVANWPQPRIEAWSCLLQARAIENMSYCVGVNRIGVDENGHIYTGNSTVIDCLGKHQTKEAINKEMTIIVQLDKNLQNKARNRFRFLEDKDAFTFL